MENATSALLDEQVTTLKKLQYLESFIGNTPLYYLDYFSTERVKIYAKLDWLQYGGSVKSKPAFQMLWDAVKSGRINSDTIVADASSGNTGIALAHLCSVAQIPLRIYIPEKATAERKSYLKALGVDVIYTDPDKGTDHSREVVQEDAKKDESLFLVDQYSNPSNIKSHYRHTGPEIWQQTKGLVTHFCYCLGTTGTFTGTTQYLKEQNSNIVTVGLQPSGPDHGLEGWKHMETASVPKIFDPKSVDLDVFLDVEDVMPILKLVTKKCGLLLSPSSAANLLGAVKLAETLGEGTIVTVLPDDASKYNEVYRKLFC